MRAEQGLQCKSFDKVLLENNALLRQVRDEQEIYRDSYEMMRVQVSRFLPINSRKGARRLFRVSIDLSYAQEI